VAALGLPLSAWSSGATKVEEIFRDDGQPGQLNEMEAADATDTSQAPRRRSPGRRPRAGSSTTSATAATGPSARPVGDCRGARLAQLRSGVRFGRGAKARYPGDRLNRDLPARAVNAFAMSRGNQQLVYYDTYAPVLRDLVMTVFVASSAELVSRDLRSRVLPLYFSRPIKPGDYPLAKYLGFTAACLVMLEVPLLLLFAGAAANVHGGAAVWAQTRALIPGLLVGLMWAVSLAAIGLFSRP